MFHDIGVGEDYVSIELNNKESESNEVVDVDSVKRGKGKEGEDSKDLKMKGSSNDVELSDISKDKEKKNV